MRPYNFAVLRYVHSAFSGETVNVGVLVWVPETRRIHFDINDRYGRLSKLFSDFDGDSYRQMARSIRSHVEQVAEELTTTQGALFHSDTPSTPQDVLDALVPPEAPSFRWSEVMGGAVEEPSERFAELFRDLVTRHEEDNGRPRRDDAAILSTIERLISADPVNSGVSREVQVHGSNYDHTFPIGWMNGKRQVLEAVSFDYVRPADVVEKANQWTGRLLNLDREDFEMTSIVAPPQGDDLRRAYERAIAILRKQPKMRDVVLESEAGALVDRIRRDLAGRKARG